LTTLCSERINNAMIRVLCFTFLCIAGALDMSAVEMLRPEQLKSGMKGYGLSVFKGTTPERFEVEVLGVLKNALPKQDMVLIRLSGLQLEHHKVIAGMSGSPIYIEGKLIGALAYGWTFENDPIAGVTPIHNMLAELDKKPGTSAAGPAPLAAGNYGTPHPLLTPLALGGFSQRTIEMFADKFEKLGILPVAGGGSAGNEPRRTSRLEPGSSVGVELIRGDLNATGVGTVTYTDGDKILAFGHPFFLAGQISAPATEAEVHTILSNVERSFKMASSVADAGSLVGDWQSCIVVDRKAKAAMIPVTVDVANRDTGDRESYRLEIADNPALSPMLAQLAIAQTIQYASGSSRETTVRVQLDIELPDRTLSASDTFFNPTGGLLNLGYLQPVIGIFHTPFGDPKIKRIAVRVQAEQNRQTAEIRRAYFDKAEVERGEHALLHIVLRPFGKPEITKTIEVEVPATTDSLHSLNLAVLAGNDAPPDFAPPDSMTDYLDTFEKSHKSTDLVVIVQTPTQGLQYRGKQLKKLPASVLSVLDDDSRRDINTAADTLQLVAPTDWVLTGQATVHVPIRQE
jgi:hypothetical protein